MKKQNLFHVQDTVFNPGKPDTFIDISASKHRGGTEGRIKAPYGRRKVGWSVDQRERTEEPWRLLRDPCKL